jgi:hypothetical protein
MKRKKNDPAAGLSKRVLPNLALYAEVTVVKGKHAGTKGKVVFARREEIALGKDNIRLTIDTGSGSVIVDMDDIKGKYETLDITLFMPSEERAAFEARVKELEEFGYEST